MWVLMTLLYIPGVASLLRAIYRVKTKSLERNIAGLSFSNPIGLAAGFDKDGRYIRAMSLLGFGHLEIGTVTPRSQTGNPLPRLFRLVKSCGLINRMGFNNDGAEAFAERLTLRLRSAQEKKRRHGMIIGANIGKNKDTPNEDAVNDYLACFTILYDLVDYFTVNVSSPNTPGLRSLQDKEPLTKLLTTLQQENKENKPIFLKIAPDLTHQQLDEIIEIVIHTGITGMIATNTTITREGLKESKKEIEEIGAGGLSGAPLLDLSVSVVKYLSEKSNGRFIIIGVGGIGDASSAKKYLDAGADLIQIYTGMIYAGPGLVKNILQALKIERAT